MIKNLFIKFYFIKMISTNYFKFQSVDRDITLTPNEGHDSTLIFMHGLGDSAEGYIDVFNSNAKPIPNKMKVVLLTAPQSAVTINSGMVMNSWYDIKDFNRNDDSIEKSDVDKNSERIKKVIEIEVAKLNGKYNKIFIGGFSQGACMALHVGLTHKEQLGGVVALSGLLFPFTSAEIIDEESKKNLPIFIAHGAYDGVIPEPLSKLSYKYLIDNKYNVKYTSYNIEHTFSIDELNDVKSFLNKLI
jgi:phospholipase/carboxylesterase